MFFALKTTYLPLKVAPTRVAIRSVGQAYVEKLKEQALAKMPKNPPPPALAMHAHQVRGERDHWRGWTTGEGDGGYYVNMAV